ncbi:MAG: 4Fe-4S dicluster domain-containing protein, partial [Actinobacteria bacterium]|nr:4Fe-4S dicluster domain-containing protein [Actinomycetota bacterium]
VGVAIMGPLGGGRIKDVEFFKQELGSKKGHIDELALKFVFSNKNISIALSGMESMEMVEENLKTANGAYMLTEKESAIINKFLSQKELGELIPCTNCKYCLPCPSNVNIPKTLKLMNYYTVTGLKANASWQYKDIVLDNTSKLADSCTECGECEEKCPQGIKIVDKLKESHNALG